MNGRICFVCFFYSSQQTNQIRPFFFWENLHRANLLFGFNWPLADHKLLSRFINVVYERPVSLKWELMLLTPYTSFCTSLLQKRTGKRLKKENCKLHSNNAWQKLKVRKYFLPNFLIWYPKNCLTCLCLFETTLVQN